MSLSEGPVASALEQSSTSRLRELPSRVLLLLEDPKDELLLRVMINEPEEEESWRITRVETIDDALYSLREHEYDVWIVDSQLVTNAGIDLVHLVQSENIEAALILLVSGDHPFAPAADMIDWAHVLVREEVSSQGAVTFIENAVVARREQVAKSRLVRRDQLTGLLNRVGVSEFIGRALRQAEEEQRRFGVCVIDVDGYDGVLRRYGKSVGDELIIAVGRRLLAGVSPSDVVGRIDERTFVAIFIQLEGISAGDDMAVGLLRLVKEPYEVQVSLPSIAARVGLSVFPDTLYAPEAMIEAARWGLNDFDEDVVRNEGIELGSEVISLNSSHKAGRIDWTSLEVALQPQVDLNSGEPFCVEALARWASDPGEVPNIAESIRALECNGMIFELDLWMLENALKAAEPHWGKVVRVAVNISPVTLLTPGFLDRLGVLLPYGTGCLEVELTETALLGDIDRAAKVLHVLRALGVRVALDDFGSGYSSLLRLQELPLDTLKLDREFVQQIESDVRTQAIVESVMTLARRLELDVVVEGVETEAQARQLVSLGITKGQGFWYGRPMSADELQIWLNHPEAVPKLSD